MTRQSSSAASIDPREVEFYHDLADTWWDRRGPLWPLHRLNELRVAWIRDRLAEHFGRPGTVAKPLQGLSVLDVGCGGGILSESMARLGASVRGIDVVTRNIEVARLHAREAGVAVEYEEVAAEELGARGDDYDVVLNMEVVEHVADFPGFLRACCELVRPGGAMFVSTINRNPLSWLFAIVGAEYVLGWLPKGTHRWSQFRRPNEIQSVLARKGLEVQSQAGVRVNPVTRRFSLQRSLAVNFMQFATREKPGGCDKTTTRDPAGGAGGPG
jgi:2-polyprenyl-6-hydroxyphenyl methylase/3-demethylubiquinone-9 3-methyltransferase